MGEVITLKAVQKFPRDEYGVVVLECGQKWIDRDTGRMGIIAGIEPEYVNDETQLTIYLVDFQGKSWDHSYTEDYFREWFDEAGEYWAWRLQTIYGGKIPRKRGLVVVQGGKKA